MFVILLYMRIVDFVDTLIDTIVTKRGTNPEKIEFSVSLWFDLLRDLGYMHGTVGFAYKGVCLIEKQGGLHVDEVVVTYDSSIMDVQSFNFAGYSHLPVGNVSIPVYSAPPTFQGASGRVVYTPQSLGSYRTYGGPNTTIVTRDNTVNWLGDPVSTSKQSCNHTWKTYEGLTGLNKFDYCDHCDIKRECQ